MFDVSRFRANAPSLWKSALEVLPVVNALRLSTSLCPRVEASIGWGRGSALSDATSEQLCSSRLFALLGWMTGLLSLFCHSPKSKIEKSKPEIPEKQIGQWM